MQLRRRRHREQVQPTVEGDQEKYSRLKKKYDALEKEIGDRMDELARSGVEWDECMKILHDKAEELHAIGCDMRLVMEPTMTFGKNFNGTLIPIEKFRDGCLRGKYSDGEGYGMYATKTGISDVVIYPSDVIDEKVRSDFDQVVWFRTEEG